MPVNFIPDGYSSITPYLIVNDGEAALTFYKNVFGAVELMRVEAPGGKLAHAEIQLGDSRVMLASEFPEVGAVSPTTVGGSPVSLLHYTEEVDEVFARAIAAGAVEERPVQDQFYGDRSGSLRDPFGHRWSISTHIEDVSAGRAREALEGADGRVRRPFRLGSGCGGASLPTAAERIFSALVLRLRN